MAKLSRDLMEELFFDKEVKDDCVVMGPEYGEDAAVIDIGDSFIVAHSDPISGAVENIGWLAINIAANDIAVSGARPRWALITIQFPENISKEKIQEIILDIYEASIGLDIDIIGGHSETVKKIDQPLITTSLLGTTGNPIYTKDAEPGDKIVQIGEAAIEGTWILTSDFGERLMKRGVEESVISEGRSLRDDISVVKNGLDIRNEVNSMHDPTEGGILQGLYEMARASQNSFVIDSEPSMKYCTMKICDNLGIDPLKLISSGSLLATVSEDVDLEIGDVIGKVESGPSRVIYEDEKIEPIYEDELFKAIRKLE
ncbi:MAG: AIR synthase related protein [Candidatus Natronoplasma sp.]